MEQIRADQLAQAVAAQLTNYTSDVRDRMFSGIDELSKRVLDEVKRHTPIRKGKYRRSLRVRNAYQGKYDKRNIVYASGQMYRLTHLLEYGHLTKNGTRRVRAYPHFSYGERLAEQGIAAIVREAAYS